jgi:hypothetical protein
MFTSPQITQPPVLPLPGSAPAPLERRTAPALLVFVTMLVLGIIGMLLVAHVLDGGKGRVSTPAWAIGLASGLALAWALMIDWAAVPRRIGFWLRLQRQRFWWLAFGAFFAGVLLFY